MQVSLFPVFSPSGEVNILMTQGMTDSYPSIATPAQLSVSAPTGLVALQIIQMLYSASFPDSEHDSPPGLCLKLELNVLTAPPCFSSRGESSTSGVDSYCQTSPGDAVTVSVLWLSSPWQGVSHIYRECSRGWDLKNQELSKARSLLGEAFQSPYILLNSSKSDSRCWYSIFFKVKEMGELGQWG